jgi:hypothetical protein
MDEELVDRERIEVVADPAGRGERGQLRGEGEAAARRLRVEERLLAEPVAGDQQLALAGVPDREGEHPLERVDHLLPVLLI